MTPKQIRDENKRLKEALIFFTRGTGLYDDYSVEDLLEEMDAHDTPTEEDTR